MKYRPNMTEEELKQFQQHLMEEEIKYASLTGAPVDRDTPAQNGWIGWDGQP